MKAWLYQLGIGLRLHFRNRMALLYSYLFPTIFLVAFWVLYRHELVPLVQHMGELLTVTVLGGACFGLPTTMVSERERGVWRRYRLAPVPTASVVGSTLAARYVLLILGGLLQLALAMGIGMPMPRHPVDLWLAFTCVAFAFLGLGLVIAMMADNVPAVQALGQCIFLPMLIIGGVAVPLTRLPSWAQHLSAFFPGRYAVEALHASVAGDGLRSVSFSVFALLLIGAAGCVAGAKMFRWDAQQRFATLGNRGWMAGALAAWVAVGLLAESRGDIAIVRRTESDSQRAYRRQSAATARSEPPVSTMTQPLAIPKVPGLAVLPTPSPPAATTASSSRVIARKDTRDSGDTRTRAAAPEDAPSDAPPESEPPPAPAQPKSWQDVTMAHIEADFVFDRLPPDEGIVTPIASPEEGPDPSVQDQLRHLRAALPAWQPGHVADPVQRVRNLLFVAAVPDLFQMEPLERYVPAVVFERLRQDVPRDDLIKLLYWVARHPSEGDDSAVDELRFLGLGSGPSDMYTTRERVTVYALKLLGRLTGKIDG